MGKVDTPDSRGFPRPTRVEIVVGVLLAYVPFFLSSPGRLSSDTKQYLYLDPGQFLARVPWMWDPHVGAGTVSHQHIGYLFPMGPFYWVMAQVGVPVWVAQRFWLGTISLAALFGARWLFARLGTGRVGAIVGALVYALSPYQLAFTARISVLLLPWAALPWIVGLTMRAARRGGWRDPALIALIMLTIGGVNASALLLVTIAPTIWIAFELVSGRERAIAALGASARIVVLSLVVSLWWIAGLWAQGSYGLPVLALTENVRTVSTASAPGDILRGLGNWFFYGYDRSGYSLVQTQAYLSGRAVVIASFLVPSIALLAGVVVRWRHRAYFATCVVVGTVVGVGAWPFDDTTPYGRLWKAFTDHSSVGLALRNTPRAVPVVVLGVAGLLAAGVGAITWSRLRAVSALGVVVLVLVALLPVWRDGFLTPGVERPNEIPRYWRDAIRALDHESHSTRILEIPGSSFATYRWGNAVEPIVPGLTTRPYLAREVLPSGSPESVNLLDAFERRIQNGSFEPQTLAPISRLFGVGTISVRNDLAYERSGAPHPRAVWRALTDPRAPGLGAPQRFGPEVPAVPSSVDATDLRSGTTSPNPPAVALFPVARAVPIVRTTADRDPVVMSGDGEGIVDLAAAGLINGTERILVLADADRAALDHALHTGAALVVTDTNRRRVSSYFSSIRDTKGATERAGQTNYDVHGYDNRADPYLDQRDVAHSVVEQHGGVVDASADGGADRPEDRATQAFDGDVRTQWRVGGVDPSGTTITIRPSHGVTADHISLVQPLGLPRDRWISRARVVVNDRPPIDVDLGPDSLTAAGQRVAFPQTVVRKLTVQILALHQSPFDPTFANAVGFAEIRLDDVRVTETVRLPVDLSARVNDRAAGHSFAVVLTRLRQDTGTDDRQDEELTLDRRMVLPDSRTYAATGTARVNPDAPDSVIDTVMGTQTAGVEYRAASHLSGDLDARASRAFTSDSRQAWTSAYGTEDGQWIEAALASPATADHLDLSVVADRRHSTPTAISVLADDKLVGSADVRVPVHVAAGDATTRLPVHIQFPSTTARTFRVLVTKTAVPPGAPVPAPARIPPVAFSSIVIPGIGPAPAASSIAPACRSDVLTVDGTARAVRLVGAPGDARGGLTLELCAGPLTLPRGSHRIVSARGWDTGIDVDRLVLDSGRAGQPRPPGLLVHPPRAGTRIVVRGSSASHFELRARTDGRPFWLVLGQSHNRGWRATALGRTLGPPTLVDGYANAWLVHPPRPGTVAITLEWTPQRYVWIALGLSAVGALLCLAIVAFTRRRRSQAAPSTVPPDSVDTPRVDLGGGRRRRFGSVGTLGLMAGAFALTTATSRVDIAIVVALAAGLAAAMPRLTPLLGIAAGAILMASRLGHRPELAWLALALFAVAVVVAVVNAANTSRPRRAPEPTRS